MKDKENKIVLEIITTGEDVKEEFNINSPLKVVKVRAMKGLADPSQADNFILQYEGQTLDEHKKIEEYIELFGWQDGTVLELVPKPEVI